MADIVKRAAAKFPAGIATQDRFARQGVLLEKFPTPVEFRELDEEFYRYPDDLSLLLAKYRFIHGVTVENRPASRPLLSVTTPLASASRPI
jgi:hypothetical protein